MQDTAEYLWRPEHPGGHEQFCVFPSVHPPSDFCAADPSEPVTLQGAPSQAWHEDHPGETA